MPYKVGDIVVRKWSNAKHLKNKTFKVIGFPPSNGYTEKVRLVSISGSQIELGRYRIHTLDNEIICAEHDANHAQRRAQELHDKVVILKMEAEKVRKMFPEI